MAGTPDIALNELPELHQDLERQHLVPLWEIAPRLLPREPQPQAISYLWRWADTVPLAHREEALRQLATSGASSFDDVALEFINPHTGGSVLPTMACWIQLIRPGVHTKADRQTNSAVYHVFRGEGFTLINGGHFAWKTGDFFVIPPWAWHEHANHTREEAILFSVQDTPILQALRLYREQVYEANGGRQTIRREFRR